MNKIITLILAVMVSVSTGAQAQGARQERTGSTHTGPNQFIVSPATFAIGMSLDGGFTYADVARVGDVVSITGIIRPDPAHIGQKANIVVVERSDDNVFTMRVPGGAYTSWADGKIASLAPYAVDQTLTPEMDVELFTGQLGVTGGKRLFLGYIPADGRLRFNAVGARVDVMPAQNARDDAMAMFVSSISNNIVQTNCIACHTSGGAADGLTLHKFVFASNPDHLSINFAQLENLVDTRGSAYVLSKVQGGSAHVGGAVLLPGSVDYNNLAVFLTLLEGL